MSRAIPVDLPVIEFICVISPFGRTLGWRGHLGAHVPLGPVPAPRVLRSQDMRDPRSSRGNGLRVQVLSGGGGHMGPPVPVGPGFALGNVGPPGPAVGPLLGPRYRWRVERLRAEYPDCSVKGPAPGGVCLDSRGCGKTAIAVPPLAGVRITWAASSWRWGDGRHRSRRCRPYGRNGSPSSITRPLRGRQGFGSAWMAGFEGGCLNCDLFDFGMGRILGGCLNCDLFDFGMGRILGGCLNCDLFDFGMGRILGDGCLNCDLFDFWDGQDFGGTGV